MNAVKHFLANVDGRICVAIKSADYFEPRFVTNYFPTGLDTFCFCRDHEVEAINLPLAFEVIDHRFEYSYQRRYIHDRSLGDSYFTRRTIRLIDGGKTKSIKVDFEPIVRPRVGKGTTVEWDSGRWVKRTVRGVRSFIDPVF